MSADALYYFLRTPMTRHTSLGDPSSRVFLLMAVSPCWMNAAWHHRRFQGSVQGLFHRTLSRDDVFYCHQMAFVVHRLRDAVWNPKIWQLLLYSSFFTICKVYLSKSRHTLHKVKIYKVAQNEKRKKKLHGVSYT